MNPVAFIMGSTRNFQVFYRELPQLVCQHGQNTTNAVSIKLIP